jgi:hypothetical protein
MPNSPMLACGDSSYLIATAGGNGRARLNSEAEPTLDRLVSRITEVLSLSFRESGICHRRTPGIVGGLYCDGGPHLAGGGGAQYPDPRVIRMPEAQFCLTPSCGRCVSLRSLRAR